MARVSDTALRLIQIDPTTGLPVTEGAVQVYGDGLPAARGEQPAANGITVMSPTDKAILSAPGWHPDLFCSSGQTDGITTAGDTQLVSGGDRRIHVTGFSIVNAGEVGTKFRFHDGATDKWRGYVGVGQILVVSPISGWRGGPSSSLIIDVETATELYVNVWGYRAS